MSLIDYLIISCSLLVMLDCIYGFFFLVMNAPLPFEFLCNRDLLRNCGVGILMVLYFFAVVFSKLLEFFIIILIVHLIPWEDVALQEVSNYNVSIHGRVWESFI